MSDILKDPTAMLAQALDPDVNSDHRLALFMALHRHKLAGGAVPAQERGEGTAIGVLLADAHSNARILESFSTQESRLIGMVAVTKGAIRAVTGDGSPIPEDEHADVHECDYCNYRGYKKRCPRCGRAIR